MADLVAELNSKQFDDFIKSGKVIVDFWASWCGPCRMQGQILDNASKDFAALGIKVGKVNIDVETELAAKFGVSTIPTLMLYQDGVLKETLIGVQQAETLKKKMS